MNNSITSLILISILFLYVEQKTCFRHHARHQGSASHWDHFRYLGVEPPISCGKKIPAKLEDDAQSGLPYYDHTHFPSYVILKQRDIPDTGNQSQVKVCGGVLIGERIVATAAHCLKKLPGKKYVATLGGLNGLETQITIDVESWIKHDEELPHSMLHNTDFALLKLVEPVMYTDYIQPACVSSLFPMLGFPGLFLEYDLPIINNLKNSGSGDKDGKGDNRREGSSRLMTSVRVGPGGPWLDHTASHHFKILDSQGRICHNNSGDPIYYTDKYNRQVVLGVVLKPNGHRCSRNFLINNAQKLNIDNSMIQMLERLDA